MARTVAMAALALLVGINSSSAARALQQQTSTAGSISGVQKVIQMLTDMSAKAKQEKKAEEVAFAKFTTWCSQETTNLKTEIKANSEDMDLLEADIGKLQNEVRTLGEALGNLNSNVANMEANKQSEVVQRKKDHADFEEEAKDYSESVDALERAIRVLKKQDYDRSGAAEALLQISNKDRMPEKARSVVAAFVTMMSGKQDADFNDYSAPEANAYEFQSSNIVELLKGLRDDFTKKLGETQKEEMNSKHAFDMVVTDLDDSIENTKKEIDEKTVEKQRKTEKAAANQKQLGSTTAVKASNVESLSLTTNECSEKKLSYAEKQKLRKEEIEAIEKAVEILSSEDVSGNAEKHLDLMQNRKASALVQMGDHQAEAGMGVRRHLRDFLASEGQRLHSRRLALLAEQLAANPFGKVMSMIDGMIKRLMEEANEDAQHEGFCDTEMGKSKITRTKLSEEIDGLSAAVEDGKATITQLGQSTAELAKEVEELVKAMTEASDMRMQEKATNAETVKDAKAAQVAVQRATKVLKTFFEKALTATALVQGKGKTPSPRKWGLKTGVKMGTEEWNALANPELEGTVDTGHKEQMQTFGDKYEGQQDDNEYGVLALLEVIQSDFATLEADTSAAEAASQKAYDEFMVESKRNQAVKEKKISMNTADKASAESRLQEDITNLKATQDELLAADRYHAKLVPQCIDQGMTFEERTAAREAEIKSLKEALKILNNEDVA